MTEIEICDNIYIYNLSTERIMTENNILLPINNLPLYTIKVENIKKQISQGINSFFLYIIIQIILLTANTLWTLGMQLLYEFPNYGLIITGFMILIQLYIFSMTLPCFKIKIHENHKHTLYKYKFKYILEPKIECKIYFSDKHQFLFYKPPTIKGYVNIC